MITGPTWSQKLRTEIGKAVIGQDVVIERLLVALLANGHVLLEGMPGLGKTKLVKTLAQTLELKFSRIQCTPDLMPADILGTTILTQFGGEPKFQPGPIFGNVVLADEINRATPKTQAAFLQAMQEGQVTIGDRTHVLERPFFVLATQNPIELEGTYPLPEAQLDRFMLKLLVPLGDAQSIVQILARTTTVKEEPVQQVLTRADVLVARELIASVPVATAALEQVARLILATHPDQPTAPPQVRSYVRYGCSPRGGQAIVMAAKAYALLSGRYNVSLSDIQRVIKPALRHRLILNFEGEAAGIRSDAILDAVSSACLEQ